MVLLKFSKTMINPFDQNDDDFDLIMTIESNFRMSYRGIRYLIVELGQKLSLISIEKFEI